MSKQTTLNARGTILSMHEPLVMGIINLTVDSFYSGSRAAQVDAVLQKAEQMLEEKADILDLGAMSSRPGATISNAEAELSSLLPAIEAIGKHFPQAILSIDTIHSQVAREAVAVGAHIINDISAGTFDTDMLSVVASLKVPYIMMHMKGLPGDMQLNPTYGDVTADILAFFTERLQKAKQAGIRDIVLDPGFGFGKTIAHNFTLLAQLEAFQLFDLPVLAGLSRKSMVWRTLDISAEEALNGTTALHMVALQNKADILRVHDVKEARQVVTLFRQLPS